jgi:ABC-type glycerol-3-phosphate transport system permease component
MGVLGRFGQRPTWMERPHPISQALKGIVLAFIALVMIFPLLYIVSVSFSSSRDVLGGDLLLLPRNPTLDAYRAIFAGGVVLRSLTVTVGLAVFGTVAKMVATILFAYGLSRPSVPGSRFVLVLVLFTLLFSPGIIPNYLLVRGLGLIDTYAALILPGLISAFNLIVLRNFFMSVPQELLDSARIDGANNWHVLRDILLPLSKPVLAVLALFYGVGIWNSFFNAILYLNDSSKWPIQVVLRQYVLQGSTITNTPVQPNVPLPPAQTLQAALVVVATVPILLVYPFLQRYFIKGVLTGAIKG